MPRPAPLALGLALAGALTACVRSGPNAIVAAPFEGPPVATHYAPVGPVPEATLTMERDGDRYRTYSVSFPARLPTSLAGRADPIPDADKPIRMTWFRPRQRPGPVSRRPAVVVSPILGSGTAFVSDFAAAFARRGWHALIVRRPSLEYDPALPFSQVEDRLALTVSRQVQALDWLLATGEVDPARVGSFGISAGGITNAMVAGADRRYAAHVIALAGGPLSDVFVDSDEKGLVRLARKATEQGLSREDLRARLRETIRTDPVLLAAGVDPEKVLLFLARFDTTVPIRGGMALREALGGPQTVWLPLGHRSSALALPWVLSETTRFLSDRFDPR